MIVRMLLVMRIYRREGGRWNIVHSHGGGGPAPDDLISRDTPATGETAGRSALP